MLLVYRSDTQKMDGEWDRVLGSVLTNCTQLAKPWLNHSCAYVSVTTRQYNFAPSSISFEVNNNAMAW